MDIIQSDDSNVEYTTESLYELTHLKKRIGIKFTKDQLCILLKDDEVFSKVYGRVLSDKDIIDGKKLINKVVK